jgi:hypothetical protein
MGNRKFAGIIAAALFGLLLSHGVAAAQAMVSWCEVAGTSGVIFVKHNR